VAAGATLGQGVPVRHPEPVRVPGDGGPDDQRRFDVVVIHDRDLVIRAAEPLLRRLVPER
jgi:hypothetical protein